MVSCRTTPQLLVTPQLKLDVSHRENEPVNKFLLHQLIGLEVRLGMWPEQAEGVRPRGANAPSLLSRAHMQRVLKASEISRLTPPLASHTGTESLDPHFCSLVCFQSPAPGKVDVWHPGFAYAVGCNQAGWGRSF